MKATEQYLNMVLLITLYKEVLKQNFYAEYA